MQISTTANPTPVDDARLAEILANPGFGTHFTDHMLTVEWTPDEGWHAARIEPYGPLTLDPATAVLHYAQETFEGMKAYRHDDGSIWTFRPEQNAARMVRSSKRLAFPELPVDDFVACVDALVETDQRWVPDNASGGGEGEKSLYLRPFMFASEKFLGVRPAQHVTFMVIASPAGAYFKGGIKPVNLWLSETFTRAGRGGMGAAKTGGNYAASLAAQQHRAPRPVAVDTVFHGLDARPIGPPGTSGRIAALDASPADARVLWTGTATGATAPLPPFLPGLNGRQARKDSNILLRKACR